MAPASRGLRRPPRTYHILTGHGLYIQALPSYGRTFASCPTSLGSFRSVWSVLYGLDGTAKMLRFYSRVSIRTWLTPKVYFVCHTENHRINSVNFPFNCATSTFYFPSLRLHLRRRSAAFLERKERSHCKEEHLQFLTKAHAFEHFNVTTCISVQINESRDLRRDTGTAQATDVRAILGHANYPSSPMVGSLSQLESFLQPSEVFLVRFIWNVHKHHGKYQ